MKAAIIAIRPEPGLASTIALGAEAGLTIEGNPLSKAEPVAWDLPADEGINTLLAGSANVFRHGGEKLHRLKHLPVHAVGQATADAARDAGFEVAVVGSGGLQKLLDAQAGSSHRYLRLAGEERITLDPPNGAKIAEKVVYRMQNLPLQGAISTRAIVLLHSASSAQHFANECDRLGLDRMCISLAALGPRILAAAGPGWAEARAAASPNDSELLVLAHKMWQ